ncbi:unnamed protein product, partial [Linum tenue]
GPLSLAAWRLLRWKSETSEGRISFRKQKLKTLEKPPNTPQVKSEQSSESKEYTRRRRLSSKNPKMVPGLRQFTDRTAEGSGVPVLDTENGEELKHVQSGVAIVIANRSPESPGTLYISSRKVVWLSDVDRQKGYAVDFLALSLHAVSRDPESFPSPCIYTQIETEADDDESDESDSECQETLDLSKVTEMRLVPSDPNQLDTLFQIFCECAELNPEPIEGFGGGNWVFSADQLADNGSDVEAPEWFSPIPTSSIGHSNGDHDIARTVLEVSFSATC